MMLTILALCFLATNILWARTWATLDRRLGRVERTVWPDPPDEGAR